MNQAEDLQFCGEAPFCGVSMWQEAWHAYKIEDDWRVPERDLKSCDSAMGLGAAPTSSARIIMTGLVRDGKPVFVLESFSCSVLLMSPSRSSVHCTKKIY